MARFRSDTGHAVYRMAYDRMLARWPSPATSRIVRGRIAVAEAIP
jgi:hypothetical protein